MEHTKRSICTLHTKIPLRDPFVLIEGENTYLYASDWLVCRIVDGVLTESRPCVIDPPDFLCDRWAPEVHKVDGSFYMFTTYRAKETGKRGCAVFSSATPEGPFVLHSEGTVTPGDRCSIDGTLYTDEEGERWLVYVDEWVDKEDGVGRMCCAKLSRDLKRLASAPIELFRADDAPWCAHVVTDGPFLYRTRGGKLLMIWSNFAVDGYCVGVAKSENGQITGPWKQSGTGLFSRSMTGKHDGGHGMLFRDPTGALWLSLHSPNSATEDRVETPVLIPLREENDTLVWDTEMPADR